ncbi:MAG TPA: DinB family protein [Ktedonobacterales bacterium]|nr:DinB family protein [Ktedonobacterales bacterium]
MPHIAHRYVIILERTARDALAQLDGLSDDVLNRPVPMPEANSLYALATHLAGAGEFWAVTLPGNRTTDRDRSAEFRATGTFAELSSRYERWIADLHVVLDELPDEALDRASEVPISSHWPTADNPPTIRDCLLHAVEHSALHLGHIQLTVQLFQNGVWDTHPA